MRKIIALLAAGIAAGVVVGRILHRRRNAAPVESVPDPRAEELRTRLAEARETSGAAAELDSEPSPAPEAGIDEARRLVHERGQAAVDEMRRAGL